MVINIIRLNKTPLHHINSITRTFFNINGKQNGKYRVIFKRYFSIDIIKVPRLGDSITEGTINEWKKKIGDYVKADETVAVIDTDKVSVDISSKSSGVLHKIYAEAGEVILVDSPLCEIDTAAEAPVAPEPAENTSTTIDNKEIKREVEEKEEKIKKEEKKISNESTTEIKRSEQPKDEHIFLENNYEFTSERIEKRVRMLPIRKRIAERLKESQNTCALLTTFNECDMSKAMILRNELKEVFQKKYGCKLGFVSLFIYASTLALKQMPHVNAFIEKDEIVYKNYIDISVAVATPNGLTVPVIRDCQNKKLPQLEQTLVELATKARNNKLSLEDLTGGTFTISNGGVFGSMLSTPIVNIPQSAILGMHTIKNRPVVVNNEIVIRPIMYLALTYDHRLLDGRDAVQFLCKIRDYIENPNLMLIDY